MKCRKCQTEMLRDRVKEEEDRKIAFYKCPNPKCERFGYKDKEKEGVTDGDK